MIAETVSEGDEEATPDIAGAAEDQTEELEGDAGAEDAGDPDVDMDDGLDDSPGSTDETVDDIYTNPEKIAEVKQMMPLKW